jgi:hypothetical protein
VAKPGRDELPSFVAAVIVISERGQPPSSRRGVALRVLAPAGIDAYNRFPLFDSNRRDARAQDVATLLRLMIQNVSSGA